jgi:hypothetical protein
LLSFASQDGLLAAIGAACINGADVLGSLNLANHQDVGRAAAQTLKTRHL